MHETTRTECFEQVRNGTLGILERVRLLMQDVDDGGRREAVCEALVPEDEAVWHGPIDELARPGQRVAG